MLSSEKTVCYNVPRWRSNLVLLLQDILLFIRACRYHLHVVYQVSYILNILYII